MVIAMSTLRDYRMELNWESVENVRAPELQATWARLEIWVGEDCVTQNEDRQLRSVSRAIYAPMYPIAEWIAHNWWLLQADSRPASLAPAVWTFGAFSEA